MFYGKNINKPFQIETAYYFIFNKFCVNNTSKCYTGT